MARKLQSDLVLFGAVVVLVVFGLVTVFSASAVVAQQQYHLSYHFLVRQGIWATLGIGAMVLMMNFDYRRLGNPQFIFPALGFQLLLLMAVFLMPRRHDTHRWFYAGPFSFQPSELAKILLVIFFAYFLNKQRKSVNDFHYTLLPLGLVTCLTVLLILMEP
ncbi:MAG: FtsW/RodA/SpoVE family cell cycle protein, partial [Terriglobia bacterium]